LREPVRAISAASHRTHVGFLEQGRREPSLSTLLILAKTLEVPLQELVDGLPVPKLREPPAKRGSDRAVSAGVWTPVYRLASRTPADDQSE
jgi:transcriptional regulator with XRE-family HTH domain